MHFNIIGDCKLCHKIDPNVEPPSCETCHGVISSAIPETAVQKKKMPEYFIFNEDLKIYEPVTFPHLLHSEIISDCNTCHHHHSEEDVTPSCKTCHNVPFDSDNLEKPGLKGAYHRKCMGCHKEYDSGPIICVDCHQKNE